MKKVSVVTIVFGIIFSLLVSCKKEKQNEKGTQPQPPQPQMQHHKGEAPKPPHSPMAPPHKNGFHNKRMNPHFVKDLGLNAEQEQKLKEIQEQFANKAKTLRESIQPKLKEFKNEEIQKIKEILTKEQLSKLEEVKNFKKGNK